MTATVGEQLRNAREQKRLTIEQAAFATRIKPEYLRALEMDEREVIPSQVQAKGFLRLYTGYLNLDSKPLLERWNGILPASEVEIPAVSKPSDDIDALPELISVSEIDTVEENNAELSPEIEISESFEIQDTVAPEKVMNFPPVAEEHLREIGVQLRERRQTVGLQYSDVEKFIHIRAHYLKALEDGQIANLPSFVQGQGMLTNYARFLELDVDSLLLKYAAALQARREALQPASNGTKRIVIRNNGKTSHGLGKYLSADLLISGGVILGLLAFAIWAAISVNNTRIQSIRQTPVSISELLLTTIESSKETIVIQQQGTAVATSVLAGESDGVPEIVNPQPSIAAGTENGQPVQVTVISRQRTWLKIIADGKESLNDRIIPGNAYTFSALTSIELFTGDASAIQIIFNGQDLGKLGNPGQVINLTFNPTGMTTPTSAPIPTATPSLVPTNTPTLTPTVFMTPTVTPFIP